MGFSFYDEAQVWHMNLDEDTRKNSTRKLFGKTFINGYMKDIKMEEMDKIQDELNESQEEHSNLLIDSEEIRYYYKEGQ